MEALQTEAYKGYTIKIFQDEDPPNPILDWDMLGSFITWLRRYEIASKGAKERFPDVEAFAEEMKKGTLIALPLYLLDHSGLRISTSEWSFRACDPQGWDWGQAGFVYVEKVKALKEYGKRVMTSALRKKVEDVLRTEVSAVDDWLSGSVFGWVVEDADEKIIQSVWGYYGDGEIKRMISEAKDAVDFDIKEKAEWESRL